MILTEELLLNFAKQLGVEVIVKNNPSVALATDFFIKGEETNRKEMIKFLRGFRPAGFVFYYIEEESNE